MSMVGLCEHSEEYVKVNNSPYGVYLGLGILCLCCVLFILEVQKKRLFLISKICVEYYIVSQVIKERKVKNMEYL